MNCLSIVEMATKAGWGKSTFYDAIAKGKIPAPDIALGKHRAYSPGLAQVVLKLIPPAAKPGRPSKLANQSTTFQEANKQ